MAKPAPKKTTQRSNQELLTERRKRRNEVIGLFCIGIGLVLWLALFSYEGTDPSGGTASGRNVSNWIGPLGANLADGLHQAFGYIALVVPAVFFVLAYWLIRYARIQFSWFKTAGLVVILLSLAGLLAMIGPVKPKPFFYWGGVIGHWLDYGIDYGKGVGLVNFLYPIYQ